MKNYFFLGLFFSLPLLASPSPWAKKYNGHCFEQHMREAVIVNCIRAKTYSRLSFGESDRVSKALILLDRIGITFGKIYDKQSRELAKEGEIDIICKFIPSFLPILDRPLPGPNFPTQDFKRFKVAKAHSSARLAYEEGGLKAVKVVVNLELKFLNEAPEYNCMSRHFLKSMKRLIEVTENDSRPEAQKFAWKLIRETFLELRLISQLDRMAAPLQAQGMGILCNELPEIPRF